MLKDLDGYKPNKVVYVLTDEVKDTLPTELDFTKIEGAKVKNSSDAMKIVGKELSSTFPQNEMVSRMLDDFEIHNIREEYCTTQENDVPTRKAELDETLERIKIEKKRAEEAYNAVLENVARLAAQVKAGTKETTLPNKDTFCIAIGGYYAIYTYDKSSGKFVLAKATPVHDREEIWATEDKNRKFLLEKFGIELPEPIAPEKHDDDSEDGDDELPFG